MVSEVASDSSEAGGEPNGAMLPGSSDGDSSVLGVSPRELHSPSGSCSPLAWAGEGNGEKGDYGQEGKVLCAPMGFLGFREHPCPPKTTSGTICSFTPLKDGSSQGLSCYCFHAAAGLSTGPWVQGECGSHQPHPCPGDVRAGHRQGMVSPAASKTPPHRHHIKGEKHPQGHELLGLQGCIFHPFPMSCPQARDANTKAPLSTLAVAFVPR